MFRHKPKNDIHKVGEEISRVVREEATEIYEKVSKKLKERKQIKRLPVVTSFTDELGNKVTLCYDEGKLNKVKINNKEYIKK